jgi:hypothetical protein
MGLSIMPITKGKKLNFGGHYNQLIWVTLLNSIIDLFFNYNSVICAIGSNVNMTLTIRLKAQILKYEKIIKIKNSYLFSKITQNSISPTLNV